MLAILLFAALLNAAAQQAVLPTADGSSSSVVQKYGRLPLAFEPNQGQFQPGSDYAARTPGYAVYLRGTEVQAASAKQSVRLQWRGANRGAKPVALDLQAGKSNYFIGADAQRWHTNVPHYGRVRYRDLYPGIDVVYYGNGQQLEYDLVLAPHANAGSIRLSVTGAQKLRVDASGDIVLGDFGSELRLRPPLAYQEVNGKRQAVAVHYRLRGSEVSFDLGKYDRAQQLVIDPVLVYGTYLGQDFPPNFALAIAVDSTGSAYVAGGTFVTKLNPAGSDVVYSTFFSTSAGAQVFSINGIAVDATGNAVLVGQRTGTNISGVLPLTPGAFNIFGGAFITKLNSTGSGPIYSSYLGGINCAARAVVLDTAGNAYVTGDASSVDLPVLNPLQATLGGPQDAFVSVVNASGTALLYSTYLGGSGTDSGRTIAVDSLGAIYVAGTTDSIDFPHATGLTSAGFVAKLNPAGNALLYSTYTDPVNAMVVDGSGNAYITGGRSSGSEAYLAKLDASGAAVFNNAIASQPPFVGFIPQEGNALALDGSGNVYVAGSGIVTPLHPIQSLNINTVSVDQEPAGAFVAKFNPVGAVLYSSQVGRATFGSGIALDPAGNVYVAGTGNGRNSLLLVLQSRAAHSGYRRSV